MNVVETAMTTGTDDMAKVRARNALKILLDMHADFGWGMPPATSNT